MDILKPQLIWIGKRCYRVNQLENNTGHKQQQQLATNEYIEDDLYCEDENDEQEFEVIEETPNRFKTIFHVPAAFFGAIIGSKGAVKKRIEGETRTEISIPKYGSSGDIKIIGTKRDGVCAARRRIELIVINCRRKQRPTHFNCIRIHDTTIRTNFIKFKDEILQTGPILGLDASMFTEPEKLHITLGVMCLMDDSDRANAIQLLNDCRESIILPMINDQVKRIISIQGIDIMNDDPSNVRCLYAKIHSETLQQVADRIVKRFIASGLAKMEFDRDSILLHMTLIMPSSESIDDDDGDSQRKIQLNRFDARHILEKYANYEFGAQEFNEIQICIMQTKDTNGFYKCTTSIQF